MVQVSKQNLLPRRNRGSRLFSTFGG